MSQTTRLQASCMCGLNRLQLTVPSKSIGYYQCHCSLCRKQSGGASNMATLLKKHQLHWLPQRVNSFHKASGFTSVFCAQCGTSLPNQVGSSDYVWMPLGIIDDDFVGVAKAHVCLASAWPWLVRTEADCAWQQTPHTLDELYLALHG